VQELRWWRLSLLAAKSAVLCSGAGGLHWIIRENYEEVGRTGRTGGKEVRNGQLEGDFGKRFTDGLSRAKMALRRWLQVNAVHKLG
jgi:hypothetical protein